MYPIQDLFHVCALSLVGVYYLHPPEARAIILGGTNGKKIPNPIRILWWGSLRYTFVTLVDGIFIRLQNSDLN